MIAYVLGILTGVVLTIIIEVVVAYFLLLNHK